MKVAFRGKILIVGSGAMACAVLPLLLRHLDRDGAPPTIDIVTADARGAETARALGVGFSIEPLRPDNHAAVLGARLAPGDLLLNLSVDVASADLVRVAHRLGVLYVDTCIEPWAGGYTDPALPLAQRTNYALRHAALALRGELGPGPTAVLAHGANPGLISHFAKQALTDVHAALTGRRSPAPADRAGWAALARDIGLCTLHVAECDTQTSAQARRPGEFVNTWSIDGFVSEGLQPAELGWGTHERQLPADARGFDFGSGCARYLLRPGAATRVRTWTPRQGPIAGFLITHNEAVSLAEFLTLHNAADQPVYRPTVHYAYHPCADAILSLHELAGRGWRLQEQRRIVVDDALPDGWDELGILLLYGENRVYWYGSTLTVAEARRLAPYNNATSLQVAAGVLGAVAWAIAHPGVGIVEAENLDHCFVLEVARPYLGELAGHHGRWDPRTDRHPGTVPANTGASTPWQFTDLLLP